MMRSKTDLVQFLPDFMNGKDQSLCASKPSETARTDQYLQASLCLQKSWSASKPCPPLAF
jgi:hypothetical protein